MREWIVHLHRTRFELEAQDQNVVGIKAQVLFNSAGLLDRNSASSYVPEDARDRKRRDKPYRPRFEYVARRHVRKPNSRNMHETEIEPEQEQDATEEVELSVEQDELVEDAAQDDSDGEDSEIRSAADAAFFA